MKRFSIAILAACLLAAWGCTPPMQPIAAQSLSRFQASNSQHINDLAMLAKQQVVNSAVQVAATQPASVAIEYTANEMEKVSWLQVQAERNNARLLLVKEFVDSRRGILNIWWDDLKVAWDKSASAEVTTSQ